MFWKFCSFQSDGSGTPPCHLVFAFMNALLWSPKHLLLENRLKNFKVCICIKIKNNKEFKSWTYLMCGKNSLWVKKKYTVVNFFTTQAINLKHNNIQKKKRERFNSFKMRYLWKNSYHLKWVKFIKHFTLNNKFTLFILQFLVPEK